MLESKRRLNKMNNKQANAAFEKGVLEINKSGISAASQQSAIATLSTSIYLKMIAVDENVKLEDVTVSMIIKCMGARGWT